MKRAILLSLSCVAAALAAFGTTAYFSEQRTTNNPDSPLDVGAPAATTSPAMFQTSSAAFSSNTEVMDDQYVDSRLRFRFDLPLGYRLAVAYMSFLNDGLQTPIANWSENNTQAVVVTTSTLMQENSFVRLSRQGQTFVDLNPVAGLPHSIYIAAVGIQLSDIERANAQLPVSDQISFTLFDVPTSQGSTTGLRYETPRSDGTSEEVTYIAFPGKETLTSGIPVGAIAIMMNRDPENYDESAYNYLLTSLRFY